ncbi:MAG: DUF4395 domain-containing protein [Actinobacteria bacterium]|jgi:hypothetical protein|nr:DUF4395 domain-containing protein [Actinomycetota bacterium]MDA2952722.1 DUF4395 domain-containing protein [Actinomycetota bacterium]
MSKFFSFPNPVNETSARIVAGGAVIMGIAFVLSGNGWVLLPLTYGFIARVLTGPRLSPLGRLATQVLTPRLSFEHRFVPGPPKRFAQGVGAAFTITASVLFVFGATGAAQVVIALLVVAAFLESAFAVCLGCIGFGLLMKIGVIPEAVCEECNNFTARSLQASAQ